VHELGHALAAFFSGGRITGFSIFSLPPHVRIAGSGTLWQESFRAVAGSGMFLSLYFLVVPFVRRDEFLWRIGRTMASWFAFIELAGWTLASLSLTSFGGANDAQRFLAVSGIRPMYVASAAALIGFLAFAFLLRADVYRPARQDMKA
jgi:hypothetical protein